MSIPPLDSVCVYCGSSDAADPAWLAAASSLGVALAAEGLRLVYGGGGVGLMGACARAAHGAGGRVLGAHMLGNDGPEIVQGLAIALNCGATKADFDRTIGLHPSAAEEFVTLRTRTRVAG